MGGLKSQDCSVMPIAPTSFFEAATNAATVQWTSALKLFGVSKFYDCFGHLHLDGEWAS